MYDLCSDHGWSEFKFYKDRGDVYRGTSNICDEELRIVTVVDCDTYSMVHIAENGAIGLQQRETNYNTVALNLFGDGVVGPYDVGTQASFDAMISILNRARFFLE